MNRRSFINMVVQGGAVVATGLPEKLLSSEASTVDKGYPYIIGPVGGGNPNPTEKLRYMVFFMMKIMFMLENQCLLGSCGYSKLDMRQTIKRILTIRLSIRNISLSLY